MDGKMSMGKAIIMALMTWLYALPWTLMPLLEVWGRFVPEGYLTSCTFDYLTTTMENKMFVLTIFIFAYCIPMFSIVLFYSQIVGHIFEHEKALREQVWKPDIYISEEKSHII
jgi:r-opsin